MCDHERRDDDTHPLTATEWSQVFPLSRTLYRDSTGDRKETKFVIVSATRVPIGDFGKLLKDVSTTSLAMIAIEPSIKPPGIEEKETSSR